MNAVTGFDDLYDGYIRADETLLAGFGLTAEVSAAAE